MFWEGRWRKPNNQPPCTREMVRTHIGVKWPNIETKPMTGTIAYEVMTKRGIPGPGVYDRGCPSLSSPRCCCEKWQRLTMPACLSMCSARSRRAPRGKVQQ